MDKNARKRAEALLSKMTLAEKAGQLNQRLYGFNCYRIEDGQFTLTDDFKKEVTRCGGLGILYGLFRADPWSGRNYDNGLFGKQAKIAYNLTQRYVIEHSRLHIPMLMSSEAPHGHQALDGYILPVNLAIGCTFNPALYEEAGRRVGQELRAKGVHLALVSVLDILRDPRWGRSEECFGEDPYLASELARAAIRGIQSQGVGVVAKHFCAQGETTGGLNGTAARIGERELHEIHLPAAKAACEESVTGFMAAYNEIDGVFCHANRHLLKDILEGEFGFSGIIMADGCAIDRLDALTQDNTCSAAIAINSGVTVGLWDTAYTHLENAVQDGLAETEMLDEAVLRILTLKYEMGLFDNPYIEECDESSTCLNSNDPSLRLSEESPVLLKNNVVLPLKQGDAHLENSCIAVIGPNADDIYRQIGDYSPEMRKDGYCTVLDGIRKEFPDKTIIYSSGKNIDVAVRTATGENICAVVLVLGGSSSRFENVRFDTNGEALNARELVMDCGEGVDSSTLRLPGNQYALTRAIRSALNRLERHGKKTPLIGVVIAGRPYVLDSIEEDLDALIYTSYPGPWGGRAIAGILSGRISPSGRLSFSLPRDVGMLPVYYNQKVSRRVMAYADQPQGPLYCFGSGFGYGRLVWTDVELLYDENCGYTIKFRVENRGKADDFAVPQVYRQMKTASFSPRVRELIGFKKIKIPAYESMSTEINLGDRIGKAYSLNKKYESVSGTYRLVLMDSDQLLWETIVNIR